jgi:hypothetical protein
MNNRARSQTMNTVVLAAASAYVVPCYTYTVYAVAHLVEALRYKSEGSIPDGVLKIFH